MTTTSASNAMNQLFEASQSLSIAERIDLAQAIWDSIPVDASLSPSAEDLAKLYRRIEDFDRDPSIGVSESEMEARLAAL
jgi:putative addiction module component (TIGR02574 family)